MSSPDKIVEKEIAREGLAAEWRQIQELGQRATETKHEAVKEARRDAEKQADRVKTNQQTAERATPPRDLQVRQADLLRGRQQFSRLQAGLSRATPPTSRNDGGRQNSHATAESPRPQRSGETSPARTLQKVAEGRRAEFRRHTQTPPPALQPERPVATESRGMFAKMMAALKAVLLPNSVPKPLPPTAAPETPATQTAAQKSTPPSSPTQTSRGTMPQEAAQRIVMLLVNGGQDAEVLSEFLSKCHEGAMRFGDLVKQCLTVPERARFVPPNQTEVGKLARAASDRGKQAGSKASGKTEGRGASSLAYEFAVRFTGHNASRTRS